MIKAGITGAAGYTGGELIRLLLRHPGVTISCIHSNSQAGKPVADIHQDLYGDIYFPMQLVLCLSEPGEEYEGGEFVLTQQVPRAQSKATVLRPRKGDALVFTTSFRPGQGSRGYYRVHMKHGISAVTSGTRYALGIIFHDALS